MLNGISRSVICLLYDRWSFRTRRSLSEKIWATSLITPRCSVPLHQPSELSCCIENRDIWAQPALTDFQHPLIKGWLLKHRQPNGSLCKPTYAEDKARADKKGRKKENKKSRASKKEIKTGTEERKKCWDEVMQFVWNAQTMMMKNQCGATDLILAMKEDHGYYYPWCTAIWSHSRPLQLCSYETEWIWEQLLD